MGCICSSAKQEEAPPPSRTAPDGPKVTAGPLTQHEYNTRILTSSTTKTVQVPCENFSIEYAYVSQRGYYPEAPNKSNQDTYCVQTEFMGNPNRHLFGVFDGHGTQGTACSIFARDNVIASLQMDVHFTENVPAAFTRAFLETNSRLHLSTVDDSCSGTTAIMGYIDGKQLCVANVGDSRACCGVRSGNKLLAVDLSHDQTPFRHDECERVKKCGARVLTIDQLEGLKDPEVQCWEKEEEADGDPPRLWTKNGRTPGTAFTRSIGDSVAERIGVNAEPECLVKEITPETECIVLASDGVFEFLSSQRVIDIIAKFDDVQQATNAIVAEAYTMWLQYETRTDDITIIVLKLKGLGKHMRGASRRNLEARPAIEVGATRCMNRPVRRMVSKQRREAIQDTMESFDAIDEEACQPERRSVAKKTPEEMMHIAETVKANFLFSHLNEVQRTTIFEVMEKVNVVADEMVIKQGDRGDHFYVIESGVFEVFVSGVLVHTYSTEGGAHASFGELSLMYGKPRAATVTAKTDGTLWRLDRRMFCSILQKPNNKGIIKVLRSVEVLRSLNIGQLQRLADTLSTVSFADGEHAIQQGDTGDEFFIITQGNVVCTVVTRDSAAPHEEVMRLGPNQYFGERALLGNARRAATVTACGRVECLSISREMFEEVIGPLQHIINADRRWRERSELQQQQGGTSARMIADLASVDRGSLEVMDVLYKTDICEVVRCCHKETREAFLLKTWGLERVARAKRQMRVMKEHNIQIGLLPAPPFIPSVVKTLKDSVSLSLLMHTSVVSTLERVLDEPMREEAAAFYAASVILALEHLHNENVVYRSWNPDSILIDEDGHLTFPDFQFAKQLEGPTYTLCGSPEFLAPEMVENQGHTQAVDFWALGVLIYFMLAGEYPFSKPDDSEITIYSNITARVIEYPSHFSPTVIDLVDQLLVRDPNMRLGYSSGGFSALKDHAWFKGVDLDTLGSFTRDTLQAPQAVLDKARQPITSDLQPYQWEAYNGDQQWHHYF